MKAVVFALEHCRGDPRVKNSIRLLKELGFGVVHFHKGKSYNKPYGVLNTGDSLWKHALNLVFHFPQFVKTIWRSDLVYAFLLV